MSDKMKEAILQHLQDAGKLESLYREEKAAFRKAFLEIYADLPAGTAREFWHARLERKKSEGISWGNREDWFLVLLAALAGGMVLKIPVLLSLPEANYFPRNLTFAFVPVLLLFLGFRSKITPIRMAGAFCILAAAALYINFLPAPVHQSDSIQLACLHLPVLFWLLLAFADSGGDWSRQDARMGFIRFSAELLVMTVLVLAAAGLFTVILLGLFQSIGYQIHKIYFDWFGIFGVGAIPVVAALILKENPGFLKQVAPMVAGIFSPLALLALMIFLPALMLRGKNLFTDRELLLVFNLLLLGVLALIFFSLSEISGNPQKKFRMTVLLFLALLTLIVNSMAFTAIFYRVLTLGITPNRVAILGGNILILSNLVLVSIGLFRSRKNLMQPESAAISIGRFLPVYGIWAAIVIFMFPLLFGYR